MSMETKSEKESEMIRAVNEDSPDYLDNSFVIADTAKQVMFLLSNTIPAAISTDLDSKYKFGKKSSIEFKELPKVPLFAPVPALMELNDVLAKIRYETTEFLLKNLEGVSARDYAIYALGVLDKLVHLAEESDRLIVSAFGKESEDKENDNLDSGDSLLLQR